MGDEYYIVLAALAVLLAALAAIVFWRRIGVRYDYRWDSFAIHSLSQRQLFQIRQNEIEQIRRPNLRDWFRSSATLVRYPRRALARSVVITPKSRSLKPVLVSWEGEPIAGLVPKGFRTKR